MQRIYLSVFSLLLTNFVDRAMPGTQPRVRDAQPMVASGLIDSLALVDILFKLEDVTGMRIPAGKVQPKDMDTVRQMFVTAGRVGRPRK